MKQKLVIGNIIRGRSVDGFWVFGGFERGSGRTFLVPVPTRDSQMLLSVIRNWIRPGKTIMSDCWRAYDCLSSKGFVHQTVNHSQNIVDPTSGAHTQNIQRLWRDVRGGIPRFGRSKNIWLHIWRNSFSKENFPITAIGYTISSVLLANYIRHASCRALIYMCYFLVFGSSAW